jgi:hypothetical protein
MPFIMKNYNILKNMNIEKKLKINIIYSIKGKLFKLLFMDDGMMKNNIFYKLEKFINLI